jgi:CBS domain-containing protein
MSLEPASISVKDVMSREVATISGDATIEDAARRMVGNRISGLPVLDANGVVVGVVTLVDVVTRLRAGSIPPPAGGANDTVFYDAVDVSRLLESLLHLGDHGGGKVSSIASSRLITVPDTATVRDATRLMRDERVHRVLVTDVTGRLAGIVSALDVVNLVARE